MGQSAQTMPMLTKPQVFYDNNLKQALGFQNPFYLKKDQQIRLMLYDGSVITKETNVISIADSEETLMLEEESRSKMLLKQKLYDEQAFRLQTLHPNTDQSASSPVKIEAPRELPKAKDTTIKKLKANIKHLNKTSTTNNVKKDIDEIETINIEREHRVAKLIAKNKHLKQTYKQLYDSIKPSCVHAKEHVESLVNQLNQKSFEITDLNAQLQEKVFVITAFKNDLKKVKGKDIVDNVAQVLNVTTTAPGRYKLDPVTLAPKDKNNMETHIYYLKHTMEQAAILREIVEQAKSVNPLDSASYSACNSMFDVRHELCFHEFVSDMNACSKTKSVKKAKKKEEWKPTGKVFTKIGYNWRPTRRTFTLVGNACPLTRITATNKVPLREPIPLEVIAQESVVTEVYTRRPKVPKTNGSNSKPKIAKSVISNKRTTGTSRDHNLVDPSSSSSVDPGCPNCFVVFGLQMLKEHDEDRSQLTNFVHKFLGTVKFGNDQIAKIMGLWLPHIGISKFQAVSPVPVAAAPRTVDLADSPVSTSIDQDAPSTSIPSSQEQEHSLIISQGFEESQKTLHFHDDLLHESLHEDSTSQGSSSNVRPIHTTFESLGRWTKDHPIANVIADPSRSVSTRKQLQTDAMWCYFDAFLTSVEPKNFKQAMNEPSWIDAMQEEIHEFERLQVCMSLTAYADADHTGCHDTRLSTSGSAQFLGDKLVSWSSKKQKSTAISSTEAKYISLSRCCA
ncbi:integrase, catalytic region, zinc finger, CCHC-type containing protein [Tanacetum coccineum]